MDIKTFLEKVPQKKVIALSTSALIIAAGALLIAKKRTNNI